MTKEIEVLDCVMGSGKTTGIIQWMTSNPNQRYIYISPLLDEVENRIPTECGVLHFVSPNTNEHNTKSEHLLELLEQGQNVSFTHSLFTSMSLEHLEYVEKHGYILVIDEEVDFIKPYNGTHYSNKDIITLENSGYLEVDTDNLGRVKWMWPEDQFKGGTYRYLKNMCDIEMLHCTKRDKRMLVTHLPIALITSASRCIVMTYLFENSIMHKFMLMKGIGVKHFTEVQLRYTEAEIKHRASENIEIITTPSINKVSKMLLSSSWYKSVATKQQLKVISNAIMSVCRKSKNKKEVMFTFPSDLRSNNRKNGKEITLPGFNKDTDDGTYWVACNTKATNDLSHKKWLIHAYNRYPMVAVSSYLVDYGFPINDDEFALSELLQWIWRSNIRNREGSIKIAFLSNRMKRLFLKWINNG